MDAPIPIGDHHVPLPLLRWDSEDQLVLTTWGSGSCPLLPTAVTLQNAHNITITLGSIGGQCTFDLTPTNSVLKAPAALDSSKPAIARIQADEVVLPPRT